MTVEPAGQGRADDDEQLLARVCGGDEAALRTLYRSLAPQAYGLALRVLRDEQLAQDAVQEAFMQVWSQAATFDPQLSSARSWVLTRVHRRAVDLVRRQETQRRTTERLEALREVEHDHVAEVVLLRAERRIVRAALATLTPLQQQVITMAYYRGMTQAQVAAELGVPLGTVKTRMRDAVIALRHRMEVDS